MAYGGCDQGHGVSSLALNRTAPFTCTSDSAIRTACSISAIGIGIDIGVISEMDGVPMLAAEPQYQGL